MDNLILGIQISDSHIRLGLVELSTKEMVANSYFKMKLNPWASADEIILLWATTIKNIWRKFKLDKSLIAIAIPGPFDYKNGISKMQTREKFGVLYNLNVKNELAIALKINPNEITIANDAICFLKREVCFNKGFKAQKTVGIMLGAGLGTAIYQRGVITDVALWNSSFLDKQAEDYLSLRWFAESYVKETGINLLNLDSFNAIYRESPISRLLFKEFSKNLSFFIKETIASEQPELIFLGGTISKFHKRFLPETLKLLKQNGIDTPVQTSELDVNTLLIGATLIGQIQFDSRFACAN